ncbi:MAG TPA: SDR family NAD(P)-dependent oxidoreductase [Spirochaetota bacterium]|nr:SDR family NAD(P)-dependent oxidoreductase [Spirochaetota bacterium]HRZ25772.1 SDR family NAD(P)-dependent oxidoreductase [Spirochaetota bacterium]
MKYYDGKTILVTGAYGGFGRQFIAQLLGSGALLILSDVAVRDIADVLGPDLARKLPADWKNRIIAEIPADLSTGDGCRELYDRCMKTGREIDIIIHNAGIAFVGTFMDIPAESCEKVLSINLTAVMRLNKLFVPGMIKRGSGQLLYVSSVAGFVSTPFAIPYTVSKFGVRSLAMALHGEIKKSGVKTSIVYPFWARTPIMKSQRFGDPPTRTMPDFFASDPEFVVRRALKGAARNVLHICPGFFATFMWYAVRFWPIIAEQRSMREELINN